jgi:Uma2 family endonuclease
MTWEEVCRDQSLADLPYKIETNQWGEIVMSPANRHHSRFQGIIIRLLNQLLPEGQALPELAMETSEGTKVPDVAWISEERWKSLDTDSWSCSHAAEICIEVASPDNTREKFLRKAGLYFAAGAMEVWLCDRDGRMEFFSPTGKLPSSTLCPGFPVTIK